MGDTFTMTQKELDRLRLVEQIQEKRLTKAEAARRLGISARQLRRLSKRYQEEGPSGLISRRRGRPSNNRIPDTIRARVVDIITENYRDFGPTLAREKLVENHDITLSIESVRTIMMVSGLWRARAHRIREVHQRRERRHHRGELIQADASHHAWFEGRGEKCALIAFIDDATSKVFARFAPSESAWDYMDLLRDYVSQNGLPGAVYSDKHSIFRVNAKEAKSGSGKTQLGRVLEELGIGHVCAHTPQAKGRVERVFGTLQDRLVKELRLAGISTIEEANKFLDSYLAEHNKKFGVAPKYPSDAHTAVDTATDLDRIFTIQVDRKVTKNLEISYEGQLLQILEPQRRNRLAKKKVRVCASRDGSLALYYGSEKLRHCRFGDRATAAPVVDSKQLGSHIDRWIQRKPRARPSRKHPWRSARL